MSELLVATGNKNKLREIRELLDNERIAVKSFNELEIEFPEVKEDGNTFVDNANKKAVEISRIVNCYVLADDSGLCVDALDGAPGVYSARYGGNQKDDLLNLRKVLENMKDVKDNKRSARFVCAITLAKNGKVLDTVEGICEGFITKEAIGDNGFGYDPIFIPLNYDKTFAEISNFKKNELSHRGKALKKIKIVLKKYFS